MNGTVGPQGEKVQKFCELLKEETNLPIEFWDERLSTVAAERSLIEGNVRRENRKKVNRYAGSSNNITRIFRFKKNFLIIF